MRSIYFVLLLWAAGSVGYASPVSVRTGEHADFTRVVLFLGEGMTWELDQTSDGYRFSADVEEGYNLSGFFALIPRTRIEAVQQRPELGELDFSVSCECSATSVQLSPSIVVIDVLDDVEASSGEVGRPVDATIETPNTVPRQQDSTYAISRNPLLPLLPAFAGSQPSAPIVAQTGSTAFARTEELATDIQDRVTLALSEGLTAGMLEISSLEGALDNALQALELSNVTRIPGVEARTSIDVNSGWTNPRNLTTQTGSACLPESFFALGEWGDTRPFGAQIGERRAALLGEFDTPQAESGVQLAQRFIHFGFGQEALQALEFEPAQSVQRRVLADIARVIDELDVDPVLYVNQVSCPSAAALWAVLATEGVNIDGRIDRTAILVSFKALPENIRVIIAPRLSRALVRLGDIDASRQVLDRGEGFLSNPSQTSIAQSEHASAQQEVEQAVVVLEMGIEETGRASPEWMESYFEAGSLAGRQFTDADFSLADAVRFEARGSEAYVTLGEAQFFAYLMMNRFEEARQMKSELRELVPGAVYQDLMRNFARDAVKGMNDGEFGDFAWDDASLPSDQVTRSAISDRLMEMGFPERANEVNRTSLFAGSATLSRTMSDDAIAPTVALPISTDANPVRQLQVEEERPLQVGAVSLQDGQDLLASSTLLREELQSRLDNALAGGRTQ